MTPLLFKPYKLNGLELPNRIVVAPMCTWLCDAKDNNATEANLVHYGSLAMGGPGLVIFECSPVEYRGRLQPDDLGIYDDRHIPGLRRINDYIHSNTAAKTAIQLGHGGRKAPVENFFSPTPHHLGPDHPLGSQSIGASAEAFSEHYLVPKEMTRDDMIDVKNSFVAAARRAVAAGFDALEIQASHGFLLSQFVSPCGNHRTDMYGGSLENRIRFPLEVYAAIRAEIPKDMPLIARISAFDWVEGGTTVDETVEYSRQMKRVGVNAVHASSGGCSPHQKVQVSVNYQVPFAERILREADMPSIAVGGITTGQDAEEILQNNQASLVAVARAILRDPYWPRNQAAEMGAEVWCPAYQRPAFFSVRKKAAEEARAAAEASTA